jgi:hypothetical protein
MEQVPEGGPRRAQVIDVVIPGLEALAQRYDQAVTHLAGLSPQV